MAHALAEKITSYLLSNDLVDVEKKDWCIYSLEIKMCYLIIMPLLVLIGSARDSISCSICFWWSCIFIKKMAGGFHMNTELQCIIASCMITLFSEYVIIPLFTRVREYAEITTLVSVIVFNKKGACPHPNMHLNGYELYSMSKKTISRALFCLLAYYLLLQLNFNREAAYLISGEVIAIFNSIIGHYLIHKEVNT